MDLLKYILKLLRVDTQCTKETCEEDLGSLCNETRPTEQRAAMKL